MPAHSPSPRSSRGPCAHLQGARRNPRSEQGRPAGELGEWEETWQARVKGKKKERCFPSSVKNNKKDSIAYNERCQAVDYDPEREKESSHYKRFLEDQSCGSSDEKRK